MSDPVIRRVRRSIDEAKNRGGMQVGMPKVTIDAADAERLCIVAEALATTQAENEALRAQLKETEEKGRVLMDMSRDLKARVAELERDVEELEYLDTEAAVGAELAADEIMRLKAKLEELEALRAPIILRKQAEAVEQCWTDIAEMAFSTEVRTPEGAFTKAAGYCADYSLRLRQQAEAAGRPGGEK